MARRDGRNRAFDSHLPPIQKSPRHIQFPRQSRNVVATLHPRHHLTPELLRVKPLPSYLQAPIRRNLCPAQLSHFWASVQGITGMPVIDPTRGALYVVSATLEGVNFVQRLHALESHGVH
jgi:hypothetical protein